MLIYYTVKIVANVKGYIMEISVHEIEYVGSKELFTELNFIIACDRVCHKELINVRLSNVSTAETFKNSATRILKGMKRQGVIQLFVFESEVNDSEKTESVYLLNKFPELSEKVSDNSNSIFIKL